MWQLYYFLLVLYISMVAGIVVKMKIRKVPNIMFLLSPILPFMVIISALYAIKKSLSSHSEMKAREIKNILIISVKYFPEIIGVSIARIQMLLDKEKQNKLNKKL